MLVLSCCGSDTLDENFFLTKVGCREVNFKEFLPILGIGSSPFSSESSSIRNSPDPCSEAFNSEGKAGQMMDLGLRFSSGDAGKLPNEAQVAPGTFFPNNMQVGVFFSCVRFFFIS